MADIATVDANKLKAVSTAQTGQSVLMVNASTNEGLSIDYDKLATSILSRIMTDGMPIDGIKLMIVG